MKHAKAITSFHPSPLISYFCNPFARFFEPQRHKGAKMHKDLVRLRVPSVFVV